DGASSLTVVEEGEPVDTTGSGATTLAIRAITLGAGIVETDKVNHVVEIESFGMSADELDKETMSSDGLQPKQADLSYVHALNEPHLHEIHVVLSRHEADQYVHVVE
ncbi:hypothetical protein Tco_0178491, partial [Tanacetum coccineum]